MILAFRFVERRYFWTSHTPPLECQNHSSGSPRWIIQQGLSASLTRWMHQSTEKTILEQSPQILVAALRPLAVGHGATQKPPEPAISACELSANWRSASRTAAQSLVLAPATSRLSPQQSPSIFWSVIPTRVHLSRLAACWLGKLSSACSMLVQLVALQLHPVKAPLELTCR